MKEVEPHARELGPSGSSRGSELLRAATAPTGSCDLQRDHDITEVVEEIAMATELLPVEA